MSRRPRMRRQEAVALAEQVATQGWKRRPARGRNVAYWEKEVPTGQLHLVEGTSTFGTADYHLQHVDDSGRVTPLGSSGGNLRDAQVKAVLQAQRKKIPVVNPQHVRNLAPPPARWMKGAVKHPGKLAALASRLGFEKKPFMKRSMAEQKRIFDACVSEYGYRSCLGSAMFLRNAPQVSRDPRMRARATALKDYLVSRYGGEGSFGSPRRNPADGQWEAIPAILMHVDIGRVTLTARQVTELTLETS